MLGGAAEGKESGAGRRSPAGVRSEGCAAAWSQQSQHLLWAARQGQPPLHACCPPADRPLLAMPALPHPRPKQLPPTVISEQAARSGLSRTLFERLQVPAASRWSHRRRAHLRHAASSLPSAAPASPPLPHWSVPTSPLLHPQDLWGEAASEMLTVQYRMNADIMDWSSQVLYCAVSSACCALPPPALRVRCLPPLPMSLAIAHARALYQPALPARLPARPRPCPARSCTAGGSARTPRWRGTRWRDWAARGWALQSCPCCC